MRANIASAWFRAGRVYVPQPDFRLRPQIVDTMNEWFKFPTGKHDDGVDAMTQAICHLRAAASNAARAVGPIAVLLAERGAVTGLEIHRLSLERVFMHLTGHALRD